MKERMWRTEELQHMTASALVDQVEHDHALTLRLPQTGDAPSVGAVT